MGLKCECNYVNLLTKRGVSGDKFKRVAHSVHVAVKISVFIIGEKNSDQCPGMVFLDGDDQRVFVMVRYRQIPKI